MIRSHLHQGIIGLSLLMGLFLKPALAQEPEGQVIIMSPRVGEVIDAEERERFNLFPTMHAFQSATFLMLPDSTLIASVTVIASGVEQTQRIRLPKGMLKRIRERIDRYEEIQARKDQPPPAEPAIDLPFLSEQERIRRTTWQLFGGTLAGVSAGALIAMAGWNAIPCDDDCAEGEEDVGAGLIFVGASLVYLFVNSAVVYGIGKHFDRAGHGRYAATFGGTLAGAALVGGILYRTRHHALGSGSMLVLAFLPTVGGILGYNGSRPHSSALLNRRDGQWQWTMPTPALYAVRNRFSPHQSPLDYRVSLVDVRF